MKSFIALSALAALAAAAPHQKRDIVWVTETIIATKYVETTETVWVTPGASETAQSTTSTLAPAAKYVAPAAQPEQQNKDNVPHNHMLNAHGPQTTTSTVITTPSTTQSPTYAPVVDFTPVTTPSTTPSTTLSTTPYVAPVPTTSAAPAYTPPASSSVAPVAPPQSSSAPPSYSPPATGGSGSSSGGNNGCSTDSGTCNDASFTYYTPGVGSCGETNTDSDYIFAYAASSMAAVGGANPNNNPMCGRKIAITAYDGSSITATLTDTCPGCEGGHLDLSPGLWNRVAKGMPGADGVLRDMHFTWLS